MTQPKQQTAPSYDPPKRPLKAFAKADITNAYAVEPFVLQISEGSIEDFDNVETREDFLANNFVVGIEKLRGTDIIRYERENKRSISTQMLCLNAMQAHEAADYALRSSSDGMSEDDIAMLERMRDVVTYDEAMNTWDTPYGRVVGSHLVHALELVAFLLTNRGRIISMPSDDCQTWEFEPISSDDVLDKLSPDILSEPVENGLTFWQWILDVTGVYKFSAMKERIESEAEDDAEGTSRVESPKKSVASKPAKPSVKKSSVNDA